MSEKPLKNVAKSYLAAIQNSIGSNTWRNFYIIENNQDLDVMRNGELSSAFFVSSILVIFGMITKTHATVKSTIEDLEERGYKTVNKAEAGDIVVWDIQEFDGEKHEQIGFYLGDNQAISNSDINRFPIKHKVDFNTGRKISAIYRVLDL